MTAKDSLSQLLHRSVFTLSHAYVKDHPRHRKHGKPVAEVLCGLERPREVYATPQGLRPAATDDASEVSCPDCRDHKHWDLWVLKVTGV